LLDDDDLLPGGLGDLLEEAAHALHPLHLVQLTHRLDNTRLIIMIPVMAEMGSSAYHRDPCNSRNGIICCIIVIPVIAEMGSFFVSS